MRYIIAIVALFFAGWFAHSAYTSKELADALQKAGQKYQILKATHDTERTALERKSALDSAKAESRLRKILAENDQLRQEAAYVVAAEFLVYARLCRNPAECSLLYGSSLASGTAAGQGSSSTVTSQEVYELVRTLDTNIEQSNTRLAQMSEQLKSCTRISP